MTALQYSLQSEITLQSKKIRALEEKFERKSKEVVEKDKFIKDFLLRRVKNIDSNSLNPLLEEIKNYFAPEVEMTDSKESKTTGKESGKDEN